MISRTQTGLIAILVMVTSPAGFGHIPRDRKSFNADLTKQDQEFVFKPIIAGSGKTKEGARFSFSIFEGPDGIKISTRTEKHKPVANAVAILKKTVRGANIVDQVQKVNRDGTIVGERIIAVVAPKAKTESLTLLLWTDGATLHYPESPSIQHLLVFEKRY